MNAHLTLVLVALVGCGIPPVDAAPRDTASISGLPAIAAAVATEPAVPVVPRTTVPAPTTTTTVWAPAPGSYTHPQPDVERWHQLAIAAGWPDTEWSWLSCVVERESNGDPTVIYVASRDESFGLLQINAKAHRVAMVAFAGSVKAFLDPTVNLAFGWLLFQQAGRDPWKSSTKRC